MGSTRRSLLIGVNGYKPSVGPLSFCASDAKRLEAALNARREGFALTESVLLADGRRGDRAPTRTNIIENIVKLCDSAGGDDTILLHFSGHGVLGEEKKLYILPLDASPASIEQTSVSWEWLKACVERSRARHKILILDACHSGAGRDTDSAVRNSVGVAAELEKTAGGYVCIASCSGGQLSYELPSLGQGVFSYYLAEGINGAADPLGRGVIDIQNLFDFVRERTARRAEQIGVAQQPHLITQVADPLSSFTISAAPLGRPINQVLVLTENPLLGHLLETGMATTSLARGAKWVSELSAVADEVETRFGFDAVYIDVGAGEKWAAKRKFIDKIRRLYPIVPFVLVGSRGKFLEGLPREQRARFRGFFFFDVETPISQASTMILDTLTQVEWDIRTRYGEMSDA